MEERPHTEESVSPKNNFWVWIVVALSTTVTSIAIWGDSQKDKLIDNYKEDIENCKEDIDEKDAFILNKINEIDTLRRSLYISQSHSIDKYIEYDAKIKEMKAKTSKENSELMKLNKQKQENIMRLTKLRNEIKN